MTRRRPPREKALPALGAALLGLAITSRAGAVAALPAAVTPPVAAPSASAAWLRPWAAASARPWVAPATAWARPKPSEAVARPTLAPITPLTATSWLSYGLAQSVRYQLDAERELGFLQPYLHPAAERTPDFRFWAGRYGVSSWERAGALDWTRAMCEPEEAAMSVLEPPASLFGLALVPAALSPLGFDPRHFDPLDLAAIGLGAEPAPEPRGLGAEPSACPGGPAPPPVTIVRWAGEFDTFRLLDCDGSVATEALDRLSVIARPPGAARPELPLPGEPDEASQARGEWLPEIKMLHPRLVWVMQRIAEQFPGRPIYVLSGYRRDTHESFHKKGRALDLYVYRTTNDELIDFCRTLRDVGCGYYPHNTFVHIDVRGAATGHALWIDDSQPGQPTHYVDAWPGVIEGGAMSWASGE